MPKPGFKSLTMSQETYKMIKTKYDENVLELRRRGVNSIAGFLAMAANEWRAK